MQNLHRRPRAATLSSTRGVALLLLLMTVFTCAQPSFASLYEEYFRTSATTSIKVGLNRCLNCKHWESCWWGSCQIPIPPFAIYAERFWEALVAFTTTFEVLVRGFTLGFGLRMLKYLFWEAAFEAKADKASVIKSFRNRALVSAVAGLSLAAFLHGSSIFIPAAVRRDWFISNDGWSNEALPKSNLPLTLYQFIRDRIIRDYQTESGTLECPPNCSNGEICSNNESGLCLIDIDMTSYFIGRLGTGLSYLGTTLEALLRGFSLGFGARMLKFLFIPVENEDKEGGPSNSNSSQTNKEEKDDFVPVEDESEEQHTTNQSPEEALLESFQHRALVSTISGISVAAVVHGSSLFVPTHLRDQWLVDGVHSEDFTEVVRLAAIFFILPASVLYLCCWPKTNRQS